jgi:hypothetical protein
MHGRRKFESAMLDGAPAGKALGENGVYITKRFMILKKKSKRRLRMRDTELEKKK